MAPDHDDILDTDRGERLAKFLGDVKGPWTKEKIITYLRANGRCEYCGADVLSSCEAFWGSDWDHILPKHHGGEKDDFDANIAVACRRCNTLKGRDLPSGVKADELLKTRRQDRINVFKPLVLEQRRKDQPVRVFCAFRELVEMARCAKARS